MKTGFKIDTARKLSYDNILQYFAPMAYLPFPNEILIFDQCKNVNENLACVTLISTPAPDILHI